MLPGAGKQKRAILNRIGGTVGDMLEQNPDIAYEEIASRLGSPNQIAAACLEELEPADVVKMLRAKKKIVRTVAAAALAVVLLWAGVVFAAYVKFNIGMNGFIVESGVEVINIP